MRQSTNPFELRGTFLVTGGTRGIGGAISKQFSRAGGRVIANYLRDEKAALALKSMAEQEGLPMDVLRADVSTSEGQKQIEARVKEAGLPLCGLIHCAVIGTHRTIDSLTSRHFDWTFALNVRALFDLVKLLLPQFDGRACILAISSMGATRAIPHYTLVGASKGALEALIRHFAAELAPRGVRANILTPGAVATDAWKAIPDGEARLAEAGRRSPIGRLATVEELALCAQFLCSPAASAINGQTLIVDGGTMILA
jgi:NAD(P)-dependent dehydrogenase (short-subunit alcohol dehydrogenase family)